MDTFGKLVLNKPNWVVAIIVLGLAALPVAIWLDLRQISDQTLQIQATSLDSIFSEVRGYYSRNVVGRIKQNSGRSQALYNYHDVPGAIPIPATLSLELGELISKTDGNVSYRFISDHPFTNRAPHVLDDFETGALRTFRHPKNTKKVITETSGSFFHRQVRIATPVVLGRY